MRELIVVRLENGVLLKWAPFPERYQAVIDGEGQDFAVRPVRKMDPDGSSHLYLHWTEARKYLRFRLRAMWDRVELDRSGLVDNPMGKTRYGAISMTACRSYGDKITISFLAGRGYDRIRLFDVTDAKPVFVAETRDCMLSSPRISEGRTYRAEGYLSGPDGHFLAGFSEEWTCAVRAPGDGRAPAFSVCMPVYDNEALCARGIDTWLCQTCRDVEIVCVDDGSVDGTSGILDWYGSEYPGTVRILRNASNRGPSVSRNMAMDAAAGKYVLFPDSGDFATPDVLERALGIIGTEDPDLIEYPLRKTGWETAFSGMPLAAGPGPAYRVSGYDRGAKSVDMVSACHKIIRADIAGKARFPDSPAYGLDRIYEDASYIPAMLSYCEKIATVRYGPCYFWEHRHRAFRETQSASGLAGLSFGQRWRAYVESRMYAIAMCRPDRIGDVAHERLSGARPQLEKIAGRGIWPELAARLYPFLEGTGVTDLPEIEGDAALARWIAGMKKITEEDKAHGQEA